MEVRLRASPDSIAGMRRSGFATVPLALCVVVVAGACGGGSGGGSPTPATSSASTVGPTPSSVGPPAVVGIFRACHKLHDDSLVLVLQFDNHDPSLLGGYDGPLSFKISAVDLDDLVDDGDPVVVRLAFHEQHRRIIVPAGEPAPSEVTLSVTTMPRDDPADRPGHERHDDRPAGDGLLLLLTRRRGRVRAGCSHGLLDVMYVMGVVPRERHACPGALRRPRG